MKTRRSKGSEAGQDDLQTLDIDLPQNMDIEQLEQLVPGVQLKHPNNQTIVLVYEALLDRYRSVNALNMQIEEMRSESVRKEVELDQTLQDQDVRVKDLEQALSSKASEVENLRLQNRDLCPSYAVKLLMEYSQR